MITAASGSASASAATPIPIHCNTQPTIMEPSPIVNPSRSPRNSSKAKRNKANSKSSQSKSQPHGRRRSSSTSSDSSSRSSWSIHSSDPEPEDDDEVLAYTCFPCRRAFATAASLAKHLASKAHKQTMAAGVVTAPEEQEPPAAQSSAAAEACVCNDDEDDQVLCPFCLDPFDLGNPTAVLSHLAAKHSFHIPHADAVADLAGLLMYLETKIHDLGHCLHCHAVYWNPNFSADAQEDEDEEEEDLPELRDEFRSGQDALKHMSARGHNAIRIESGGWREYAAFYERPNEVFATRTIASPQPSSSVATTSIARIVSGARRPALARPSALASITDASDSSSSSSRIRAVVRAGDSHALAQDLALRHSIPVHQAAKLARSGTAANALTTMSTSDIRHLAKTMEQAETSTRRAQMREYAAQAVKANKSDRKRVPSGVWIMLK
ncbi:hypothetical protein BCR44DRAFT_1116414 [Catenaria anguillulae PL171]|uniref:C2H2-type domain-containing protein n=1 Tax=Catenaria anguillulae PL171 TaxID=765915 RepID=A0A1Y2HM82_9FUNG|nr:hypothetical protein BCR44DRAFT_1116414 [Catenaria anguillulae PL171]